MFEMAMREVEMLKCGRDIIKSLEPSAMLFCCV